MTYLIVFYSNQSEKPFLSCGLDIFPAPSYLVVPSLPVSISPTPHIQSTVDSHGTVTRPCSRQRVLKHLHGQRFPSH